MGDGRVEHAGMFVGPLGGEAPAGLAPQSMTARSGESGWSKGVSLATVAVEKRSFSSFGVR